MSNFVTTQKREDISEWFRTICKVTVGNVTESLPGVLALDYKTPVSEVLATLEDLGIQSVAVCGPPNAFMAAGGVDVVSEGQRIIGRSLNDNIFCHLASIFTITNFNFKCLSRNYIYAGCACLFLEE